MPELPAWELEESVDDDEGPWHLRALKLNRLHQSGLDGSGTCVAVIDTGVDSTNADFASAEISAFSVIGSNVLDNNGHGTSMVGVIVGAAGPVAPGTRIVSIKAVGVNGSGRSKDLAAAIRLAIKKGADVISVSVGDPKPNPALAQAVGEAIAAGRVVVAAAGNDSAGTFGAVFPASLRPVIAVTAVDQDDQLLYATPPSWVDLAGPGGGIFTTTLAGQGFVTGTSPAAALVAGGAALLLGLATRLSERRKLATHLSAILRDAGSPLPGMGGPGDCVGLRLLPAVKQVKAWLDQQGGGP